MKKRLTGEKRETAVAAATIIFGAVVLFAVLQRLPEIKGIAAGILGAAAPVLWGLGLAFVLDIPARFLEKRVLAGLFPKSPGARRGLALFASLAALVGLAVLLAALVIPRAAQSAGRIAEALGADPSPIGGLIERAAGSFLPKETAASAARRVTELINDRIGEAVPALLPALSRLAGTAAGAVYAVVVTLAICTHTLLHREAAAGFFRRAASAFLKKELVPDFLRWAELTKAIFRKYFSAQFASAGVVGTMCYIGSRLLSLPLPELTSLLVSAGALIPIFGPWASIGLSALFIAISAEPVKALWFVLMMLTIQLIEDNGIYPRLIGNAIGLSGAEVIAAVVVSGGLFGFTGLLVAAPTAAVARRFIRSRIDRRNRLRAEQGETA